MGQPESFSDLIDQIEDDASEEKLSVGDLLDKIESRGFGPLLFLPSLILVLPTGAIPGVPIIAGLMILFITSQIIFGSTQPWVPQRLRRITFQGKKLRQGLKKAKPYSAKVDSITGPRMKWLINSLSKRIVAFISALLSVVIMAVGYIPFAMTIPAAAIVLFALGFSVNDGLLIAIGLLIAAAFTFGLVFWV